MLPTMTKTVVRLRAAAATAARSTTRMGVRRGESALQLIALQHDSAVAPTTRMFSGSRVALHGRSNPDGDKDSFVEIGDKPTVSAHDHDHDHDDDDDSDNDKDSDDENDVVDIGPAGVEYGGPQRGGKFKEPTRFGDWERKGRCTDF